MGKDASPNNNQDLPVESQQFEIQDRSSYSPSNLQQNHQQLFNMTTNYDTRLFSDGKKASLGRGIVGEAIISPQNPTMFAGLKPRKTKLPTLPPKRASQSPLQIAMYKTQSMNPYKAIVKTHHIGKEIIPASKYIGIHHCSIEFNQNNKPTVTQISPSSSAGDPSSPKVSKDRHHHQNKTLSQSVDVTGSPIYIRNSNLFKTQRSSSGGSCEIDSIKEIKEALVNSDLHDEKVMVGTEDLQRRMNQTTTIQQFADCQLEDQFNAKLHGSFFLRVTENDNLMRRNKRKSNLTMMEAQYSNTRYSSLQYAAQSQINFNQQVVVVPAVNNNRLVDVSHIFNKHAHATRSRTNMNLKKEKDYSIPPHMRQQKNKQRNELQQNVNYLSSVGSQMCKTSRLDLHAGISRNTLHKPQHDSHNKTQRTSDHVSFDRIYPDHHQNKKYNRNSLIKNKIQMTPRMDTLQAMREEQLRAT